MVHYTSKRWLVVMLLTMAVASSANAFVGPDGPPAILVVPTDTTHPALPAFTPSELWNIDSKVDDGMPGTGQVVIYGADGATAIASCTTASDGSASSAATAKYKVDATSKACASVFRNQF